MQMNRKVLFLILSLVAFDGCKREKPAQSPPAEPSPAPQAQISPTPQPALERARQTQEAAEQQMEEKARAMEQAAGEE